MAEPPSLSILIPTYNRCRFVTELLGRIDTEARAAGQRVTVLVSDNASPDNTVSTVTALRRQLTSIEVRLQVQPHNIGPVPNVHWLVENAPPTDYVWLFGDDDLPLPGTLGYVIDTLAEVRPALLHLPHRFGSDDEPADSPRPAALEQFPSGRELVLRHHHWITFLSASVAKRSALMAAAADAPTASPWAPWIWFTLAGREGPCAVAPRLLVRGGGEMSWRDQFRQYVTVEVASAYDEGFHLVLDESDYGRVLDGWYGSFGAEYWEPAGIETVMSIVQRFPSARGLRALLWQLARRERRLDLLPVVDGAVRAAGDAAAAAGLVADGEQRYLDGDVAGAATLFQQAIELNPTSADAWTDLGVIMYQQGHADARAAFDCALEIDPAHPEALASREALALA